MTKIKICGITNLPDALAAIHAGADYLGFNFYAKSPRYIEPSACAEITSILKREHPLVKLVGVFVNPSVSEAKDILRLCWLDLAQLHGDETPEMLAAFNGKAFKALRLSLSESAHPFLNPLSTSAAESAHPLSSVELSVAESVHPFVNPLSTSAAESVHPFVNPLSTSAAESVHPFVNPLSTSAAESVHPPSSVELSVAESVHPFVNPLSTSAAESAHPPSSVELSVAESVHPFVNPLSTSAAESAHPFVNPLSTSVDSPTLLIDAAVKGFYGGSGIPADWRAAAEIARRHKIFLAGGLTPENVFAAIEQVHPWGVDVASGVESAPGVKDAAKISAFIKAARTESKAS